MDIPTVSFGEFITLLAALFVATISAARLARLLTVDHMPVFKHLRDWWERSAPTPEWGLLLKCHYCVSIYLGFIIVLWGYFSGLHVTWWLFNGSLTVAYLAPLYVSHDGDNSEY